MSIKVGVPGGLYNGKYRPFMDSFFTELGVDLTPSTDTTKEILETGVVHCIDDACLPVKVFHGHVKSLAGKCDFILVPRFTSISKGEYICPKFGGLPEMVKYSVPDIPELLDVEINVHKNERSLFLSLYKTALKLKLRNPLAVKRALHQAMLSQQAYELSKIDWSLQGPINPKEALKKGPIIGVVAHTYLLDDSFMNLNLFKKLESRGVRYISSDMVDPHIIEERCKELPKRMFWSGGKILMGGTLHMMDNRWVSGILFLTAFGCGIDSLVAEYLERHAKKTYNKPFMILNVDEHTGDANFNTRLDAFLDLMNWRSEAR